MLSEWLVSVAPERCTGTRYSFVHAPSATFARTHPSMRAKVCVHFPFSFAGLGMGSHFSPGLQKRKEISTTSRLRLSYPSTPVFCAPHCFCALCLSVNLPDLLDLALRRPPCPFFHLGNCVCSVCINAFRGSIKNQPAAKAPVKCFGFPPFDESACLRARRNSEGLLPSRASFFLSYSVGTHRSRHDCCKTLQCLLLRFFDPVVLACSAL